MCDDVPLLLHFPTQEMLRTTARVLIPTTCSAHTRSILFFLKEQRSVQNGPFVCAMIRQSLGKFRARRRHSLSDCIMLENNDKLWIYTRTAKSKHIVDFGACEER